jgi:hypothetical protein
MRLNQRMQQHVTRRGPPTDADLMARQAEVHAGAATGILTGVECERVRSIRACINTKLT